MEPRKSVFLGKCYEFAGRQRVYATAHALEIDEVEGWDVTRKRVLFDEILLVTQHHYLGWVFLLLMGLLAALFGLAGVGVATEDQTAGIVVGVLFSSPFAVAFLVRLVLGVDVVTVYGKRTRAVMKFSFRKDRAREVFDWVCEQARRARERPAAGG